MKFLLLVGLVALGYGASIQSGEQVDWRRRQSQRRAEMLLNRPLKNVEVGEDIPCDICEAAVTELHELLANPHTLDDIKAALRDNVCNRMTGDWKEMCDGLVDNVEVVIHFINPMLVDERSTCQKLDLCSEGYGRSMLNTFSSLATAYAVKGRAEATSTVTDLPCDECKFAIGELKSVIGQKDFQDNPTEVCQELGLCQGGGQLLQGMKLLDTFTNIQSWVQPLVQTELQRFYTVLGRLHTSKGISVKCIACEFGINTFKSLIEDSTAELDMVVNKIEGVITAMMPDAMSPAMNDFLDYYGRTALIMTIRQLNTEKFCDMIKACDEADKSLLAENVASRNILECEACEGAVDYMRYELDKPEFQQSVVAFLKNLCKVLPVSADNELTCQSYLATYVPYGIQAYAAVFNSDRHYFCKELGACSASASAENEI